MNLIATEQLVQTIMSNKNKFFEAELILDGFMATHFIIADGKSLFDEGIDGVEQEISPEAFIDFYKDQRWHILQVV